MRGVNAMDGKLPDVPFQFKEITIPAQLAREVEAYCAKQGIAFDDFILYSCRAALEERKKEKKENR